MEEGPVWSSMKVRRSDAVADLGMLVTRTVVFVVVLSSIGIFPTEGKKGVCLKVYAVAIGGLLFILLRFGSSGVLCSMVISANGLTDSVSIPLWLSSLRVMYMKTGLSFRTNGYFTSGDVWWRHIRSNQQTRCYGSHNWLQNNLMSSGKTFVILFLLLTTFVQGLTKIQYLQNAFPFLRRVSDWSYINLISGYLPSLVLTVFLMVVPPLMMLFSTLDSWIERIGKLTVTRPKDFATLLAELIPRQASFFMTYVMTSGWSGLSFELLQPVGLIGNWLFKCILMKEEDFVRPVTFSYHTEFMNVYFVKYQIDESYWPLAHNATIFALILTQVVAGILFGMKKMSTASTLTIPLIICTALFNDDFEVYEFWLLHLFSPLVEYLHVFSWMGIGLDWMTNKPEDGNLVWGLLLSKIKK
ncbi:CSC1-like protein RXW8, partial [Tanacetum coccineum]